MQRDTLPLSDAEIAELDAALSSIHAPFEPMDASAVDGYVCGVLLQPVTISPGQWLPLIFDVEGRPVPRGAAAQRIEALVLRRHAELDRTIAARRWFDPWIFESDDPQAPPSMAQLPWVAGFAAALDRFPALSALDAPELVEPLAVLYAAFDPEDLEDADDLLAVIETLEPPATMADAAEDLVRSVLLLADVSRPAPLQAKRRAAKAPRPRATLAKGSPRTTRARGT